MAISLPFNFCRLNTTIVGIAGAFRTRQRMTILIVGCLFSFPTHAAVNIPITVNLSESVNVTGTPQIAVDVGGTTRQATYTSGTGTNALTFALAPQAGDVDLDGVTVSSPIDLNGGTIKDTKGNDAVLTFTPPNTANVKVNYPSLGMDFIADADGRYTLNGTVYNDLTSFLSAAGGTFTRASIGTYFDSTGTLQTAASGTPRFDYDPVTHTAKGILIEEARTNMLTRSSEFDNGAWTKSGGTIQADIISAPDGTLTGERLTEDSSSSTHRVSSDGGAGSVSSYYTFSIFIKSGERTKGWIAFTGYTFYSGNNPEIKFDLSSGTITSAGSTTASSIHNVGNGWYKISMTAQMTTLTNVIPNIGMINSLNASSYAGDSTSGFYLWGAQLETGPFPTSYIPTTTATVTRAADILTIPTGAWYNPTEGSLAIHGAIPAAGASVRRFATLSNGTINNTIQLANAASNTAAYMEVRDALAIQASMSTGVQVAGSYIKNAEAYKVNDFALTSNGSAIIADTSGTVPTINKLTLGSHNSGGGNYINGYLKFFKYYPARVTNAQLQLLTQ